jgi:Mrp family chromosome partitioning ATPase
LSTDGPSLALVRDPDSAAAEAYRFLRTALQSAGEGRPRTLVVASAERDKGLDTAAIAANLAVAFARSGVATLLVDAEVRRPTLHEIFALDNSRGLTDCLSQPTDAPCGQATSV